MLAGDFRVRIVFGVRICMPRSRQFRLPLQPSRAASTGYNSKAASQARFDERNRICAELILADIDRYGGEQALSVEWARKIVAKAPAA